MDKGEDFYDSLSDPDNVVTPKHTTADSEASSAPDNDSRTKTEPPSQSNKVLAEDPFGNEASKLLFDAIDQLRNCGAGRDLDLPQLVIVGKQSAGKSSLLESLTEIPFPVGGRLCTRFATRIISRRTTPGTPDMIHVSIEQGDIDPFGDSEDDGRTGNFNPPITAMTPEVFKDIVQQASDIMGLSSIQGRRQKNFSSKVLKIELSGPGRSHFGILDVPGIFETATRTVTEHEMEGVKKMVISYMEKPQNIIICVADAMDDLANQRIFTLAEQHVDSDRVVGVFTKCDQAEHPDEIVQIVKGKEGTSGKTLHHGWYVVQNRGHRDDPLSFDREKAEKSTFSKDPWPKIPQQRRGTAMLKRFLSNLLCRRIREAFPHMQHHVGELLKGEVAQLTALGNPRPTHSLQRAYLVAIAQRFQTLAKQALKSPEDLPSDEMKLRGMTQRAKTTFAYNLRRNGHFYEFVDIGETEVMSLEGNAELGGEVVKNPVSESRTLYDEIRTQIIANQGEELQGMVNPVVLKPLLQKQASKWPELAKEHLENLADITERAVLHILELIYGEMCITKYTREELEKIIAGFAASARNRAKERLATMWHEEATLHLQTNNPIFKTNIKKSQLERFKAALERYKNLHPPTSFLKAFYPEKELTNPQSISSIYQNWTIISTDTIEALFKESHSRMDKNVQDEIHDLLKAYYEVAQEDFISYVNKHIAEPFLQDSKGPVLGFSTEYILDLSDDRIEELGGEDEDVIRKRKHTEATIRRFEAAKEIAEQTLRRTRALEV